MLMMNDSKNLPMAHPKSVGKVLLADSTQRVEETNLKNFFCGKFVKPITFTRLGILSMSRSTLSYHVLHVLSVSPKPEVVRVDTQTIITTMEDHFTRGDGSIVEFPGEAMGEAPSGVGKVKSPIENVPVEARRCCPLPTTPRGLIDLGPESRLPGFHQISVAQRRAQC